jgi:aryl-alcohol dehydrogenase-like predicted oxidoreductase
VTPDAKFPDGDFRNNYFRGDRKREVHDRCRRIAADIGAPLDALPDLALRFCLSHPAVSTVIPGMRTSAHVEANAAASGRPLSPAEIGKLRPHRWVRNFYAG